MELVQRGAQVPGIGSAASALQIHGLVGAPDLCRQHTDLAASLVEHLVGLVGPLPRSAMQVLQFFEGTGAFRVFQLRREPLLLLKNVGTDPLLLPFPLCAHPAPEYLLYLLLANGRPSGPGS
jgi:hypothetical protein